MKLNNFLESVENWYDFVEKLSFLDNYEKGDLFEQLTKQYLLYNPIYRAKLKHVWLLKELSLDKKELLNIPNKDMGIDLVAQTHSGEFWAIQCKYRNDKKNCLSHTELSTFGNLVFGISKKFDFALVATSTEKFHNIYQTQDDIGFLTLDIWESLSKDFWEFIKKEKTSLKQIEPKIPRPHQQAVLDLVPDFLNNNSRGKIIHPCGAGKSLTAYWIYKKLLSKTVVVVVPSLSLVRQTLKVWTEESLAHGENLDWLCICSDDSVGNVQDSFIDSKQDLGIPCTTKTEEICSFLEKESGENKVVFVTYQSGEKLAESCAEIGFLFDLGIFDEAHKTVGNKSSLFSHLLFDENIMIKKRLFMTATERIFKGSNNDVIGMDDVSIYGETLHQFSFKEAIETNPSILCDYKILTLFATKSDIVHLLESNPDINLDKNKETDLRSMAALIALAKSMQKYPITHTISFHSSIRKAKNFKLINQNIHNLFKNKYDKIDSFHVSGKVSAGARNNILSNFSNKEKSLITNARCLTEGVDVPKVDGILFVDPKKSIVDIVQAVGRALRPFPEKKLGYILIPVILEENTLEEGEFKEILKILSVLATQDKRIVDEIKGLSKSKKSSEKIVEYEYLSESINIDIKDLEENIRVKSWKYIKKINDWLDFGEARNLARKSKIITPKDWKNKYEDDLDIPSEPEKIYKNRGWGGWKDFLGTGVLSSKTKDYITLTACKDIARRLGITKQDDWEFYWGNKRNFVYYIPLYPSDVYGKNIWESLRKEREYNEQKKNEELLNKLSIITSEKERVQNKIALFLKKCNDNFHKEAIALGERLRKNSKKEQNKKRKKKRKIKELLKKVKSEKIKKLLKETLKKAQRNRQKNVT